MKPLPIRQQIKILEEVLSTSWNICGMCGYIEHTIIHKHIKYCKGASNYIPSFTHENYVKFYSRVKEVQSRK